MTEKFQLHADLQRDGIVIGHFPLSLVLLINDANYPWFVLVPQRAGLRELLDLNDHDYQSFWEESKQFSQFILPHFQGEKLNVAALGNVTPQLHVHHVVRYKDDLAWPGPIWGKFPANPYSADALAEFRGRLAANRISGLVWQAAPK